MKKLLSLILLLTIGALSASTYAGPRNRQKARAIAEAKAKSLGITMQSTANRRKSKSQKSDADSVAGHYIFNNGGNHGWTVVSGDDRVGSIIAYSDEGSLDDDSLPEVVKEILGFVDKKIEDLGEEDDGAQDDGAQTNTDDGGTTTSPIGPLCVTKWDQYEPYSNNCPTVSSGKHAATCCVATAFAQILYYLYYTKGKQNSTTFTTAIPTPTNTAGYVGSAVAASDRTYNWSLMLTDYAGKDYTDEQAEAIAKLMADIGSSFNVKYGTTSSYSTTDDYMSSLTSSSYPSSVGPTYWGIAKPSDLSYNGSVSSVSAWKTAINGELDKYYPVQIGGNGHAFVCDGRDANDMYHMNFGYDGRGDGFYSFDAINGYGSSMRVTYGMRIESTYPTEGLDKLQVVYDAAVAYADDEPVGTVPGNYRQEYYDALQTLLAEAKTALDSNGSGMTDDELVALGEEISTAQQNMIDYRYPYPTGTYYLKSYDDHSGTDVVIYASGTSAKYGPISTSNDNYKWQITYDEDSNGYQIKNVGTGTYINSSSSSAVTLGSSSTVYTEITPVNRIEETNSRFTNSYWDINYATTLRPITSSMASSPTFIVISYSDGTGGSTSGSLIGWHPYNDWDVWIPVPIDVDYSSLEKPAASFASSSVSIEPGSTATNQLTTNSKGTVTYTSSNTSVATVDANGTVTAVAAGSATITARIAKTDTYSAASASYTVKVESTALRAELDALIAKGSGLYTSTELATAKAAVTTTVSSTGLIQSGDQLSTTCSADGSDITAIIDNVASTYWHSAWTGGSVSTGTHYFTIELTDDQIASGIAGDYLVKYTRRSDATDDFVTELTIYGTDDASETGKDNMNKMAVISLPYSSSSTSVTDTVTLASTYKYLNVYITNTYCPNTTGQASRGYGHIAEFNMYELIKGGATDKQLAMIELDDAITVARKVTYATQEAIDALKVAIENYNGPSGLPDPTIKLEQTEITLTVGNTATNKLTTDSEGTVTYSSSDTSVATVDANGKVTAVKAGTATITVSIAATESYLAGTASYTVTVTSLPVPSASFASSSITLAPTETATNTLTTSSTGSVTYASSDEKVATVDANGKVTAVGEGTANITATIAAAGRYSSTTASYSVTVTKYDQEATFTTESVTIQMYETTTNVATTNGDGAITYESSDVSVATVDANTGEVTGVGTGTARIIATAAVTDTYNMGVASYTVTVTENSEVRAQLDALIETAESLYTDEELEAAKSSGETTFVKATSITSGNKYLIGYDDNGTIYYLTSTGGVSTTASADDAFTLETSETTCTIQNASGNYLQAALNGNTLSFSSSTSDFTYGFTDEGTCQFTFTSSSKTEYLRIRSTRTNGFNISSYTDGSTLTLYEVTTTPASEEAQALLTFAAAVEEAKATTPATQAAINVLTEAINDYDPNALQTHELGDVNLDGKIDIADIAALIHILKGNTLTGGQGKTDIDSDNDTDTDDVKALKNLILKKDE